MENTSMKIPFTYEIDDDEEIEEVYDPDNSTQILELRDLKRCMLSRFSPEVKKSVNLILDELLCETLFNIHKELKLKVLDPRRFDDDYRRRCNTSSLIVMAENLNITKPTQEVACPKCFVSVKCILLSKHLACCMNPHQSTYSYSRRNSSRIARQRIQEGFKITCEETKIDSEDERVKPKRRSSKGKKPIIKSIR